MVARPACRRCATAQRPEGFAKRSTGGALEDLFRIWDSRFREKSGTLSARVRDLFESFLRCGDLHFGFLRLRCVNPDCPKKTERLLPYSCRARGLCPSCGQRRAIEWAERMVEEVLPLVPYRQLVFTIPIALRKSFLFNRSLYGPVKGNSMKTAAALLMPPPATSCGCRHRFSLAKGRLSRP